MTCQNLKFRPKAFAETMRLAGFRIRKDMTKVQLAELNRLLSEQSSVPTMVCGSAPLEPVCSCGYVADHLCDFPIGGGKTCDINMCEECAREIGDDKHLCEIHWHEFQNRTGVVRMNPLGPRIVK